MWTLTPAYAPRAKYELLQRRMATEARHADELKAIDAQLAEITAMEQAIDVFARKYKQAKPMQSSKTGAIHCSRLRLWREKMRLRTASGRW